MEFFNSLTLDLKIMIVAIAVCALLALFTGNRKAEKRYALVVTVLAAAGLYRFMHVERPEPGDAASVTPHFVRVQPQHTPLVSTSAK